MWFTRISFCERSDQASRIDYRRHGNRNASFLRRMGSLNKIDEVSHALFTAVLLLKGVSHSTGRYKALNYWRIFSYYHVVVLVLTRRFFLYVCHLTLSGCSIFFFWNVTGFHFRSSYFNRRAVAGMASWYFAFCTEKCINNVAFCWIIYGFMPG